MAAADDQQLPGTLYGQQHLMLMIYVYSITGSSIYGDDVLSGRCYSHIPGYFAAKAKEDANKMDEDFV